VQFGALITAAFNTAIYTLSYCNLNGTSYNQQRFNIGTNAVAYTIDIESAASAYPTLGANYITTYEQEAVGQNSTNSACATTGTVYC